MRPKTGLIAYWKGYDRELYLKAAVLADRLGYHSFWLPEVWGYESFSLLTEMALRTKRIHLGTGIVNAFSRSPALIGMSAATVDEISGGRFILGIGTSGKNVIEGFHAREYKKPLTQVRDVIRVVRALLDGTPLHKAGAKLNDYRPFELDFEPTRRKIPIYVAALNEKSIRSIGELADGWMPIFWPYQNLADGRVWVDEGARAAGRDPKEIETVPFTTVIPIPGRRAAKEARDIISFYIGGMGEYYRALLSRYGYEEDCDRIGDLYQNKETRKQATEAVTDQMIEALTISGDPLHCRRELARRRSFGIDLPIVNLPPNLPWPAVAAFITAMAPSPF